MTAPERIWAWHFTPSKVLPEIKGGWTDEPDRRETEYIRHDAAALTASPVVQDMIRQAVEAEREACAGLADDSAAWYAEGAANAVNQSQRYIDERMKSASDAIAAAIRARKGE